MEDLFRDEKKVKKRKKANKATLSFALDDEEGEESGSASQGGEFSEPLSKKAKSRKNPEVDTSFLPDREREEADRREREALRQEWLRKQEDLKNEEVEIVYSYWDGSGHRKSVSVSLPRAMQFRGGPDHLGTRTWNAGPRHIGQEGRHHLYLSREVPATVPRAARHQRGQYDVCEGMEEAYLKLSYVL